jgi:hypothetical protein
MRKVWSKWLAVAVIALSAIATSPASAQGSVSLQVFYDELQPYGTWIDHGRYGYVWMPNAGSDFVPYGSNGYWVQTGYGNTWVSNYSWGWAPFHYGRWFYDDFYGWLWVPDTTWGPAWVTWRSGGGYYGWAPLMPGLAVSMSVGYYNQIPNNYWNFVPYRYVMYRQVYRHCVPRPHVVNVINHTTVIVNNNYYNNDGPNNNGRRDGRDRADYFTGPSRSDIEKRNGERLQVYDVHDRNSPGRTEVSRSSVSLYKPAVETSGRTRALPAEFTRDNEQGRENINEMRSRQSFERGSGDTYNNGNRDAMRRDDGAVPGGNRSMMDRSGIDRSRWNTAPNSTPNRMEDLRRERQSPAGQQRRTLDESDRSNELNRDATRPSNSSRQTLERTNRDADFNNLQRERESSEQQRQMRDMQQRQQIQRDEQMQRFREQRQQSEREQSIRYQQQRDSREQMQRQNQQEQQQRQRQFEAPRQSPSRESGGFQRGTEAQQQHFAPSQQRQMSQPRMSAPQNRSTSGSSTFRSGNPHSSGSQRSRH